MKKNLIFIAIFTIIFFALWIVKIDALLALFSQDRILLEDGGFVQGWIWDEKGGLVIGQAKDNSIFIYRPQEIRALYRNQGQELLKKLM